MIHGAAFLFLAAELVWVASAAPNLLWWLAYPALSFAIVGFAYLAHRPELLGKGEDGTYPVSMLALHLPFHVVGSMAAGLRRLRRGGRYHEIVDGVWLGERTEEMPEGIERVVDLTVEHSRVGPASAEYILIGTLDAQAPDEAKMRAAVTRMIQEPKPTYVHCFAGKGRSATCVAAYLLTAGHATSVDDAERQMRAKRPVVKLGKVQRAVARRFEH